MQPTTVIKISKANSLTGINHEFESVDLFANTNV